MINAQLFDLDTPSITTTSGPGMEKVGFHQEINLSKKEKSKKTRQKDIDQANSPGHDNKGRKRKSRPTPQKKKSPSSKSDSTLLPRAANPRPPSSKAAALNQRVNGGLKDKISKEKIEAGNYKAILEETTEKYRKKKEHSYQTEKFVEEDRQWQTMDDEECNDKHYENDYEREFDERMDEVLQRTEGSSYGSSHNHHHLNQMQKRNGRYNRTSHESYHRELELEEEESENDDDYDNEDYADEDIEEYLLYEKYLEEKQKSEEEKNRGTVEDDDEYLHEIEEEDVESTHAETKGFIPLGVGSNNLENYHMNYDPSMNAHILIATPCYGGVIHDGFAQSLLTLSNLAMTMEGIKITIKLLPGDSLVTRARNTLVALFLGSKTFTHLLFIDSDITFSPGVVFRLLEASHSGKPIVAAPYPKKGLLFDKMTRYIQQTLKIDPNHQFDDMELSNSLIDFVFNSFSENEDKLMHPATRPMRMSGGFVRVDNAGTGFLMIDRYVLEEMRDAHPELAYVNDIPAYSSPATDPNFYGLFDTMIDPHSRRLLSEDYAFCRRAQEMGFEIWMDLFSDLKHSGVYTFDGDFAQSFVLEVPPSDSMRKEEEENKTKQRRDRKRNQNQRNR